MTAVVASRALSTRQFYWLLIAPAVLMMAAFYLYPLFKVLWISFAEPQLGLSNYERLFTSEPVQRVLWVTARICVTTTAITMMLGYVVAYAMVHASEGQLRWLTFFVLLPLWISVLVRAFAWVTLLRSNGLINGGLQALGLIAEPLPLLRNEIGVMIGMVHYMIPFAVLPLYANMRGIDLRLIAAARGLGAGAWQSFARIFLPLSMPGIVGAGVLVFIFSLGFYVTPAILGGGRVLMVSEYIGVQILNTIRWGLGAMLATTLLVSVLLLLAALSRIVDLRNLFGAR
ncbi:MAG: ABC transporter permease [Alphaproteobacteria bacterium]|nr:ABC transporter permease [Alphaproteobacteria bacterium]